MPHSKVRMTLYFIAKVTSIKGINYQDRYHEYLRISGHLGQEQ